MTVSVSKSLVTINSDDVGGLGTGAKAERMDLRDRLSGTQLLKAANNLVGDVLNR
jgi:hypothetical protein